MKKKILAIVLSTVLALSLGLVLATPVSAADPIIIYGTLRDTTGTNSGDVYEIDVANYTSTELVDISTISVTPSIYTDKSASPNGNAFDVANQRFYFASFKDPGTPPSVSVPPSELYFIDLSDLTTIVHAGTLDGHASDGAFYDGSYWYIGHGTEELQEVSLKADGTINTETTAATNITGEEASYLGFGDIEIDCNGVVYISATIRESGNSISGVLFGTYDPSTSEFTKLGDGFAYQLAFGPDGTLWGHSAGDGKFYTINTSTGVANEVFTNNMFTDLAGTLVCPIDVSVDIKPTSCPNPINFKSKGVLPVAILGTDEFDVTQIDPASVRLEGVAPLRWAIEDVATPFVGDIDDCYDCTTAGQDGYDDLTLKFSTQEIVAALGDVNEYNLSKNFI